MAAIQQVFAQKFGIGRLFATPNGGTQMQKYADVYDIEVDFKVDMKEIYGEGQYAISVADGHRSIDLTCKHYSLDLASFATDNNLAAPASSTNSYIFDETLTIASHTYTLANAPIAGSLDVIVYVTTGGITYPVKYKQVTGGAEVASVSYSLSGSVLTFASGDTATTGKVSYEYANTAGQIVTITSTYQNSAPFYTFDLFKRDRSPIDNSVSVMWLHLAAVRFAGIKLPFKEGEFSSWDRTFKAFADPTGAVGTLSFINQ